MEGISLFAGFAYQISMVWDTFPQIMGGERKRLVDAKKPPALRHKLKRYILSEFRIFNHANVRIRSVAFCSHPLSLLSRAEWCVNRSDLEPIRHVAKVHGRENQVSRLQICEFWLGQPQNLLLI